MIIAFSDLTGAVLKLRNFIRFMSPISVLLVSDFFHPTHLEFLSLLSDSGLLLSLFLKFLFFSLFLSEPFLKFLLIPLFEFHDLLGSLSSVLNLLEKLVFLVLKHSDSVVEECGIVLHRMVGLFGLE